MAYSPATLDPRMRLISSEFVWTTDLYHQLIDGGILTDEHQVELLLGKITQMSPIGRFHAACIRKIQRHFWPVLTPDYSWSSENPITLRNHSEPEPDFCVLRFREDDYATGHPGPQDVLLVVEVADTTLDRDRHVKRPIYAGGGIPEYWIVNLFERQIEVCTEPDAEKGIYANEVIYTETDTIEHALWGPVPVENLLPQLPR